MTTNTQKLLAAVLGALLGGVLSHAYAAHANSCGILGWTLVLKSSTEPNSKLWPDGTHLDETPAPITITSADTSHALLELQAGTYK